LLVKKNDLVLGIFDILTITTMQFSKQMKIFIFKPFGAINRKEKGKPSQAGSPL